jgi:hypothetical protein
MHVYSYGAAPVEDLLTKGGSPTFPGKLYQSLQLHNDNDQEKVPGTTSKTVAPPNFKQHRELPNQLKRYVA